MAGIMVVCGGGSGRSRLVAAFVTPGSFFASAAFAAVGTGGGMGDSRGNSSAAATARTGANAGASSRA